MLLARPVQYVVRRFRKGDEVPLARILSECFGPITPRLLRRWFRQDRTLPEQIFIGEVNGKPVSTVQVVFKRLHLGEGVFVKTGGIAGVCTDSDYRRRGIVTNLMRLGVDFAKSRGASTCSLYTDLDIPAHRIYSRLGFVDVMTWRSYTRYLDYPYIFSRWIRMLNRLLKDSKVAVRRLRGWERCVVIRFREVGWLGFRFRKGRFQRLRRPPKSPDIVFSTDIQTYVKIRRGVLEWDEAVEAGRLEVERGDAADIAVLIRILRWKWED